MRQKIKLFISSIISVFLIFVMIPITWAAGPASMYKVTLTKFELFNGASWVTILDGSSTTIDIASASAGQAAGSFISGVTIPDGTYTRSRVTPSATFTIKGNDGAGNFTTATIGPGGGCTPTTTAALEAACTVSVPGGVTADTTTFSTSISMTNGVASHKVRVSFDVSTAVQTVSGEMFPAAPTVTVTVIAL